LGGGFAAAQPFFPHDYLVISTEASVANGMEESADQCDDQQSTPHIKRAAGQAIVQQLSLFTIQYCFYISILNCDLFNAPNLVRIALEETVLRIDDTTLIEV
jgi:hypothetical protein